MDNQAARSRAVVPALATDQNHCPGTTSRILDEILWGMSHHDVSKAQPVLRTAGVWAQSFTNITVPPVPRNTVTMKIVILQVRGGAWEPEFRTSTQETTPELLLRIPKPHLRSMKHKSRARRTFQDTQVIARATKMENQ